MLIPGPLPKFPPVPSSSPLETLGIVVFYIAIMSLIFWWQARREKRWDIEDEVDRILNPEPYLLKEFEELERRAAILSIRNHRELI